MALTAPNLQLVNTLCESKLVPNVGMFKQFTAQDIADLTFLYFLVLFVLKEDENFRSFVHDYARETAKYSSYDRFYTTANDLYMLLHILSGHDVDKLKDQVSSNLFLKRCHFSKYSIETMLRMLYTNRSLSSSDYRFLSTLEQDLKVPASNLKSIRRMVNDWMNLEEKDKRIVVTRILQALQVRAPRSELLSVFKDFSRMHNFELRNLPNDEYQHMDDEKILQRAMVIVKETGMDIQKVIYLLIKGKLK